MTKLSIVAAAAAITLTGCSSAYSLDEESGDAYAETLFASGELVCDVTAEPTVNGVLIEAHAFADRDVYGEYDFVITKLAAGGSSDVSQGGEATIAAGQTATLGQVELSLERGARIRANLIVSDEYGELCRRSVGL